MFGSDVSFRTFGIAPLSFHWIYKLIEDKCKRDGFLPDQYSVAVSAVEITGREEKCRDLLQLNESKGRHRPATINFNLAHEHK